MERNQWLWWLLAISALLTSSSVQGIRFVIDKKECWFHEIPLDGDEVLVSYVVIKSESMWSFDDNPKGVDLVVSFGNLAFAFGGISSGLDCLCGIQIFVN